ncbi:hypothetical protein WMY93_024185 [Mugilogobius chulae]|uniref:Uncharacterized protein n=1 Tax=Mugilogobius chulae TaxID=88201 RepID=A0AAW0MYX4_9GOBI
MRVHRVQIEFRWSFSLSQSEFSRSHRSSVGRFIEFSMESVSQSSAWSSTELHSSSVEFQTEVQSVQTVQTEFIGCQSDSVEFSRSQSSIIRSSDRASDGYSDGRSVDSDRGFIMRLQSDSARSDGVQTSSVEFRRGQTEFKEVQSEVQTIQTELQTEVQTGSERRFRRSQSVQNSSIGGSATVVLTSLAKNTWRWVPTDLHLAFTAPEEKLQSIEDWVKAETNSHGTINYP